MCLVKTSKVITDYVLPVYVDNGNKRYKFNRYYECESDLFKAYYQLKKINCKIKPLYPVIYGEIKDITY